MYAHKTEAAAESKVARKTTLGMCSHSVSFGRRRGNGCRDRDPKQALRGRPGRVPEATLTGSVEGKSRFIPSLLRSLARNLEFVVGLLQCSVQGGTPSAKGEEKHAALVTKEAFEQSSSLLGIEKLERFLQLPS